MSNTDECMPIRERALSDFGMRGMYNCTTFGNQLMRKSIWLFSQFEIYARVTGSGMSDDGGLSVQIENENGRV